jgi:DNA modification methylase
MIDLIKGDCLEVMKDIPDKSIDAVITDIPYGTTACKWDSVIPFDLMWEQLNRIIKDNSAIVLFGTEPFSSKLRISNLDDFKYDWVWSKKMTSGFASAKYMPMKAHEIISVFNCKKKYNPQMVERTKKELKRLSKKSVTTTSSDQTPSMIGKSGNRTDNKYKYPNSIINITGVMNRSNEKVKHPTQKPVALMEYLIKTYTNKNETVLDFTMGSGTTGVACVNTNRNFIGIELDENYFKIAEKRIKEAQSQTKLF